MNRREFVTEVIDESKQAEVIRTVVDFLASNGVTSVKATYGFVIERDLRGEKQGQDTVVSLMDTRQLIKGGLNEGTIEWSGNSNFQLTPVGMDLELMLCNDSDLHFTSANVATLMALTRLLSRCGVRVYDSGNLVSADR